MDDEILSLEEVLSFDTFIEEYQMRMKNINAFLSCKGGDRFFLMFNIACERNYGIECDIYLKSNALRADSFRNLEEISQVFFALIRKVSSQRLCESKLMISCDIILISLRVLRR